MNADDTDPICVIRVHLRLRNSVRMCLLDRTYFMTERIKWTDHLARISELKKLLAKN